MTMNNDDKYSRNQCSFVIRVDGDEIEIPVNFGMTSDEIKTLYPFILPLANTKIKSPAVEFAQKSKDGTFNDVTDEDYDVLVKKTKLQSKFWFDKTEASLLELAVRFAIDIKLKGIEELSDMFDTPLSIESIKTEPITESEAQDIIRTMGLETSTDYEHDPGDEQDIPLGIAGGLNVNLYDSGEAEDYLSQELDALEAKEDVQDKFAQMLENDSEFDEEKYKSNYKAGKFDENRVKDGLLDMYDTDNDSKSVFDKMDEEDGLFAETDEEDDFGEDPDDEESFDDIPFDDEEEADIDFADEDGAEDDVEDLDFVDDDVEGDEE